MKLDGPDGSKQDDDRGRALGAAQGTGTSGDDASLCFVYAAVVKEGRFAAADSNDAANPLIIVDCQTPCCWMDPTTDVDWETWSEREIFSAAFADGSVCRLPADIAPETLQALAIGAADPLELGLIPEIVRPNVVKSDAPETDAETAESVEGDERASERQRDSEGWRGTGIGGKVEPLAPAETDGASEEGSDSENKETTEPTSNGSDSEKTGVEL